jgi:tripeptidyl-peptidase-2
MTIWIERKLEKEIPLSVYATKEGMMVGKNSMKKQTLRMGTHTSIFFAEPPTAKIPSACKPGDILFGTAYYASGDASLPGDGKRPKGWSISYLVGPKPAKATTDPTAPEIPDERTVMEKMNDAVRDLKIELLGKLTQKEKEEGKFEEVYAMLEKEYPGHLPLLVAGLKNADSDNGKKKRKDRLNLVVEAADKIIKEIDQAELALHFGKNHDKEDPKAIKEHKEMEEKKRYFVEALARKARAYADMDGNNDNTTKDFDETLAELKKWVDIDSDQKYAVLVLERDRRAGRFGSMLKLLNALLKKNGETTTKDGICPMSKADILARRAKVLMDLGYTELVDYDSKRKILSSPKSFMLF